MVLISFCGQTNGVSSILESKLLVLTWNDPPSKPQPPKPPLVQTGTTMKLLYRSYSHHDWLETKHFGCNASPNDRYYCLRSMYVSLCSFLASSNYYLGSELLLMTARNEPRPHIPILPISSPSNGSRQEGLKRWKRGVRRPMEGRWEPHYPYKRVPLH